MWKLTIKVLNNSLRGFLQVTGPGVVSKAGPVAEHIIHGGFGQGMDVREAFHERFEVGDNGGYLGLLQHDFRDPHPVGVPVVMPRQVMPAVAVVPLQQLVGETVVHQLNRPFSLSPSCS